MKVFTKRTTMTKDDVHAQAEMIRAAIEDDLGADEAAVELLETVARELGPHLDQLEGYDPGKGLLLQKGGTEMGNLWLVYPGRYLVVRSLGKGAEQHTPIGSRQAVLDWGASGIIQRITDALVRIEDWSATARYRRVAFRAAADLVASIPE